MDTAILSTPSDSENDLNIANTTVKTDDTLLNTVDSCNKSNNSQDSDADLNRKRTVKKFTIIDSDSDDDDMCYKNSSRSENFESSNDVHEDENNIRDTISEPLSENNVDLESTNEDLSNKTTVYKIDGKGNVMAEDDLCTQNLSRSNCLKICDSESSDEEISESNFVDELSPVGDVLQQPEQKNTARALEIKKMTPREAAEQRQEIRSVSQRMLRESRVSLPYHKPKIRSIKEFLANRPRLSSAASIIGTQISPCVAIKMSNQKLDIISKKLEEREKELEQFYKSESESGDDHESEDDLKDTQNENVEVLQLRIPEDHAVNSVTPNLENTEDNSNELVDNSDKELENLDAVQSRETSENNSVGTGDEVTVLETAVYPEQQTPNDSSNLQPDMDQDTISEKERMAQEPTESNLPPPEKIRYDSQEFDFSLDDIDEDDNSENINKILSDVNDTIENFPDAEPVKQHKDRRLLDQLLEKFSDENCPQTPVESLNGGAKSEETVAAKFSNKAELLERLQNTQPRLRCGPDDVIDLDDGFVKPNAITKMMERFLKHASLKNDSKHTNKVDIISVENGELHKETLAMSTDAEEPVKILEIPGAKLQKLRSELESQMAQRRSELWQQKQTSQKGQDTEEKEEDAIEDDILDDDEECELTDSDTSVDDEEEEMKYVEPKQRKVKSAFVDEEAEESEAEEVDEDMAVDNEENGEYDGGDEDDEDQLENDNMDPMSSEENEKETLKSEEDSTTHNSRSGKKRLKRILKPFTDDSDDEDIDSLLATQSEIGQPSEAQNQAGSTNARPQNQTLDTTDTWEDDDIPPHQPRPDKTPRKEMTQTKSDFGFLTPVLHLTGLQSLNSGSKFLHESPISPFSLPPEPSPLKDKSLHPGLQKKLFTDANESLDTSERSETAMSRPSEEPLKEVVHTVVSGETQHDTNTQDVLDIISGNFTDSSLTTQQTDSLMKNMSTPLLPRANEETSTLTALSDDKHATPNLNNKFVVLKNSEVKDLDEDKLISQLLDEEEMEKFKKQFDSPVANSSSANVSNPDDSQIACKGGRLVLDSSDDSDDEQIRNVGTRKNQRKLAFSDDESEESDNNDDEEISLHDEIEEDEDRMVDYDSEENEIERTETDVQTEKVKASDFFEKEAELTESEWDSADEDERDLDTLDYEQGDAEQFDENEVRRDLEKIHMRHLLDEDNREVKILQELLLEDGELHGAGRQRQFKWRNIDSMENDPEFKLNEDDVYFDDEEESEEQWRKMRHEREMFLSQKQEKLEETENDEKTFRETSILSLGRKILQRNVSSIQINTSADTSKTSQQKIDVVKQPFSLLSKRGSFLSRSDAVLTRLAEFTKVTDEPIDTGPKKSKNFVFQTVDRVSVETNAVVAMDKKRKAAHGTPNIIKKLRLSTNLSPAGQRNSSKKKKLF